MIKQETLVKVIPYLVLTIAVIFTLYSMAELQQSENNCNRHLQSEFQELMAEVEKFCPMIRQAVSDPTLWVNITTGSLE